MCLLVDDFFALKYRSGRQDACGSRMILPFMPDLRGLAFFLRGRKNSTDVVKWDLVV